MAEDRQLIMEKVLGFRMKEVLDTIQATASRMEWSIIRSEEDESSSRLTICFSGSSPEFRIEVSETGPRALTGSMKVPQTRLSVWARGADHEEIGTLTRALHIAFLRAGG